MFRKIVSNLAFSPALVGQLGFYAKRLRKEEATRRIGLIFTALALVVQSFAVFVPPDAANAASSRDFIYGGVSSIDQFVRAYDKNQGNLKDIFTYAGVTRSEITKTKLTTWTVGDTQSWGRKAVTSTAKGEVKHSVSDKNGKVVSTVYSHPQKLFFKSSSSKDYGWVGHSKKLGWFAISKACANLVTKRMPTPPPKPVATCRSLTIAKISRTKFTMSASGSVKNGAAITGYSYTVKNNKGSTVFSKTIKTNAVKNATSVTLPADGTYVANVAIATTTGIKAGGNCRKNINVTPPPAKNIKVCDLHAKKMVTIKETDFNSKKYSKNVKDCDTPLPVYVCQSLSIKQISRDSFKFSTEYSVKNAKLKSIVYTVKDASGKQLYKGTDASYTQKKSGTYIVSVVITVDVNGKTMTATSPDCSTSFTVKPATEKVCVLKDKTIKTINTDEFDSTKHSRNLKDCDDVIVPPCPINPSLPSTSEDCQPCPGDDSIWVKDENCSAQIVRTKSARNITTQKNATAGKASAGQSIEYTVTVRNDGTQESSADIVDELRDVLEYATLINAGSGTFDKKAQSLTWEVTSLAPGAERSYSYVIKMNDSIAAMATGVSDAYSYDCRMVNTFGNAITVNVNCPPTKVVESVVSELPTTGPGLNMLLAGVVSAVVIYFYARSRQLGKEVRLIRRDLNSGTL